MSTVSARIFRNSYRDSVELMQIAAEIESLDGIDRAGLVMATPANREVLAAAGLLSEASASAGPNDLVVAVASDDESAATQALERAAERLAGPGTEGPNETTRTDARTLAEGVAEIGANLALISTPGTYAAAEALKALKRGLNVFLFSDNVSVEDEIELKSLARARGLLVMGPDCGTAILDGVPLGFANAVRRGTIGLVGASGTGLQQVSCLIDRYGAGVSQAIGVGGRDLDERVGGTMMLAALERLGADPGTDLIVLISKPPSASVTELVLAAARAVGKPVIVNFLAGDPAAVTAAGSIPASTFEAAAAISSAMALGRPVPHDDAPAGAAAGHGASSADDDDSRAVREAQADLDPTQWRIRGLYSGGSLAGEAKLVLGALLGATAAKRHEIVDLGDDEYTVGRPHPMIDPRLRNEHLAAAAADPSTAVVLLDVVLGYGANADPAGALASAIGPAREEAARDGRRFAVVASVCGTSRDPQDLVAQEARLAGAGVILAPSNARAALLAARIVAPAAVVAGMHT
jgi:FdrA protein